MPTLTIKELETIEEAVPLELTLDDQALMLIIDTRRFLEANPKKWCRRTTYNRYTGNMCALGTMAWKAGWTPEHNLGASFAIRQTGPVAKRARYVLDKAGYGNYGLGVTSINDDYGRKEIIRHFKHVEDHWDEYTAKH